MLRATERVFVTQSALSLQMKRLEEIVQSALFQRDGRRLALTPAGQSMLSHAREILAANDRAVSALNGDVLAGPARIGFVQDFAENLLSGVLARFARLNPETQLQVRVGRLTGIAGTDCRRTGWTSCSAWGRATIPRRCGSRRWSGWATPTWRRRMSSRWRFSNSPAGFATPRCRRWKRPDAPYRIVLETPSLAALRAAVDSGLGITCRTAHFMERVIEGDPARPLPALPEVAYTRHIRSNPHPTITRLADLVLAAAVEL